MALHQSFDPVLEGVQLARSATSLALLVSRALDPVGDGFGIQVQLGGDLGDLQALFIPQLAQSAEGFVIDHWSPPSSARRKMAAIDLASPVRGAAGSGEDLGSSGRDNTW